MVGIKYDCKDVEAAIAGRPTLDILNVALIYTVIDGLNWHSKLLFHHCVFPIRKGKDQLAKFALSCYVVPQSGELRVWVGLTLAKALCRNLPNIL